MKRDYVEIILNSDWFKSLTIGDVSFVECSNDVLVTYKKISDKDVEILDVWNKRSTPLIDSNVSVKWEIDATDFEELVKSESFKSIKLNSISVYELVKKNKKIVYEKKSPTEIAVISVGDIETVPNYTGYLHVDRVLYELDNIVKTFTLYSIWLAIMFGFGCAFTSSDGMFWKNIESVNMSKFSLAIAILIGALFIYLKPDLKKKKISLALIVIITLVPLCFGIYKGQQSPSRQHDEVTYTISDFKDMISEGKYEYKNLLPLYIQNQDLNYLRNLLGEKYSSNKDVEIFESLLYGIMMVESGGRSNEKYVYSSSDARGRYSLADIYKTHTTYGPFQVNTEACPEYGKDKMNENLLELKDGFMCSLEIMKKFMSTTHGLMPSNDLITVAVRDYMENQKPKLEKLLKKNLKKSNNSNDTSNNSQTLQDYYPSVFNHNRESYWEIITRNNGMNKMKEVVYNMHEYLDSIN